MKTGKLFGIGVGPGDPGLLTVKAVETIKNADIIITPKTEKKDGSVAYNIARKYIPENVEILPSGKKIVKLLRKSWMRGKI